MPDFRQDVVACAFAAWSPVIGDPTIMGWFTVVAYVAAGLASARVAIKWPFLSSRQPSHRWLWSCLSFAMLVLAINKQLDLQSLMTSTGRCLSQAQGWYDDRRAVQETFILLVLGVSSLLAVFAVMVFWRSNAATWLAVAGFISVLAFVTVRAAGFHHVDLFINRGILFFRMNSVFELFGIALVLVGALLQSSFLRQRPE